MLPTPTILATYVSSYTFISQHSREWQYSDGGAGGFVNGYHMLTLSDARILNVFGKVHTGYAFTDPVSGTLVDIGLCC